MYDCLQKLKPVKSLSIFLTNNFCSKVPYSSPLEGSLSMVIQSELQLDDEFRGFLTMFDDISGFGAWHRRWCLLSAHVVSYWKYPDDEQKKVELLKLPYLFIYFCPKQKQFIIF